MSAIALLGATLYAGVALVGEGLKSVKPEIVTFVQCAVGVLTLPTIDPAILHTSIELRQWRWLSGLGVIHTALAFALIYHALPKLKTSAIAILTFIYPASPANLGAHINEVMSGSGDLPTADDGNIAPEVSDLLYAETQEPLRKRIVGKTVEVVGQFLSGSTNDGFKLVLSDPFVYCDAMASVFPSAEGVRK
jgi:hypothetical protein